MNNTYFKSTRSIFFTAVVIITVIGLIAICVTQLLNLSENIIAIIPIQIICWLCIAFLLWVFFGTNYRIGNDFLFYKSGPIQGKIEINKIEEIIIGQKFIVSLKPATGNNGLIIKYNRWDEIYISPDTNEKFIEAILKQKNTIKITDLTKI